jgi:hypothetical protein
MNFDGQNYEAVRFLERSIKEPHLMQAKGGKK